MFKDANQDLKLHFKMQNTQMPGNGCPFLLAGQD